MRLEIREASAPVWRLLPLWVKLVGRVIRERPLWLALIVGLLAIALAYQRPIFADVGPELDQLYTAGFHDPERSDRANFRWTTNSSALVFSGVGKPLSPMPVSLQLSGGPRPDPVEVAVLVNGHTVTPLSVTPGSASYSVMVDPAWIDPSGDLRIQLSAPTFRASGDKRDLGIIVDFARIEIPTGTTLPSLTQLLLLSLCALLLYLMLRGTWLAPLPSGLITLLFLLGCAGVVAIQRLLLTTYTAQLAIALALALLVGILGEAGTRLLTRAAGWRGERALPEWAWAGLRALLMATVALKVGGLLHPHSFIIDAPFHFRYITFMAEGKPWEEYFGENLALSVMPKEEWGSARAFIPYSPFFYVVAAPLAWLPVPLSFSVPVASGLFETLRVALVFMVGLALGRAFHMANAARAALAAATVYAITPSTFLLQQWGNWPTQTSLWLLALWTAITCLFWGRITSPLVWIASTLILTLTMLAYTVTAVYTGIFVGLLVVLGWLFARNERRRWAALALALIAATALALLIYYGQYLGRMIGETLPTFGQAIEEQGKLTTLRPDVWSFVTGHLANAMQSYHLAIIYALGLAGALWLFLGLRPPSGGLKRSGIYRLVSDRIQPRPTAATREAPAATAKTPAWKHVWLGAWLLTFPIFTLADYWVDQALKEFWFALPAVAVVAGGWLLALLQRGRASRWANVLVLLLGATLVWQSLSLWVFRLFLHNRI